VITGILKKTYIFLLIVTSSFCYGVRLAKVTHLKSAIYADPELKTPIGYISRGKKIYVGNKNYKSDHITTVIVSGKLAYIKISDIIIDSELFKNEFVREQQIEYLGLKSIDSKKEEFHYNLSVGYLLPIVSKTSFNAASSLKENLIPFSLFIDSERYSNTSNYFWGLGFNYIQFSGSSVKYKTGIFKPKFGWTLFRNEFFKINLQATINLSMDYRLEFSNKQKFKGDLIGSNIELSTQFLPKWAWSIKLGAGISKNIIFGLKDITVPISFAVVSETQLSNQYYFLSLNKYF